MLSENDYKATISESTRKRKSRAGYLNVYMVFKKNQFKPISIWLTIILNLLFTVNSVKTTTNLYCALDTKGVK